MAPRSPATNAKRVTLKDVAALAGVHPSAVSRAVNNDPNLSVSEETRRRIMAAVERLGYRANLSARGLRVAATWTVGLIIPSISNPMYETIVRGVENAAVRRGYEIVIGSQIEGRSAQTFANLLRQGRVEGLLVASGTLHDDFIREIAGDGRGPVITVNRRVIGVPSSVIVDDERASGKVVGYLHDLDHRELGGIFGPGNIDTAIRRRRGFQSAIKRMGLRAQIADCVGWSARDGYLGTIEILERRPSITAVYASTLLMGIGALRAAAEMGRSVPASLSIVSLHDHPIAEFLNPPLTTIRLPTERLGAQAIDLLIELRSGGRPRGILIEGCGEIVERASHAIAPSR